MASHNFIVWISIPVWSSSSENLHLFKTTRKKIGKQDLIFNLMLCNQILVCSSAEIYFKVTADVHVYHATAYQYFNASIATLYLTKAIFTHVGFWFTFLLIENAKINFFILISFTNVSTFLQVAIMFDFR